MKPFAVPKLKSIAKPLDLSSPSADKTVSKEDILKKIPKTPTMGITLADITQVKLRKRASPKPNGKATLEAPKLNMQLRKIQKSPGGTPLKAAPIPAKTNSIASPLYHAIQTKFKGAYSDENAPPTPNNASTTMNTSWT
jgi:hypothetical protein